MHQRIIVPLDGSELAEAALPHASELARLMSAAIHLVYVVDEVRLGRYGGPSGLSLGRSALEQLLGDEYAEATVYLREIEARLKTADQVVNSEVRRGHVVRELLAATQPGDVIVIASHGRGGASRWLLGSIAEDLIRQASTPVLLVKARGRQEETPETPASP